MIAVQPGGSPWADPGRDLPSAEGLSLGVVCCKEAAGSGKESAKVNSNTSQEAAFLTKQKPFLSVPQEVMEWLQVLDLNQKKSFGILIGSDYTLSISRWMGISKGKFGFNVRAHSSRVRGWSPPGWCLLSQSSCSEFSLLSVRSQFLVNVFTNRSGKILRFPVSFVNALNTQFMTYLLK